VGCDLITDILPVIAAKTAEPRPQPIRSWAYFTPAIIEAKARREATLAQPKESSNEQNRGGHGKAKRRQSAPDDWRDAWDAAVAKADLARAEAPFLGEERRQRAVEPQDRPPALLRIGLDPVAPRHALGLLGREPDRGRAVLGGLGGR
jgi:hypothetical protein